MGWKRVYQMKLQFDKDLEYQKQAVDAVVLLRSKICEKELFYEDCFG